jgi:hypothetical protein
MPCWTYVSGGLWTLGQKEIVISLLREEGESPADLPEDPFGFFAYVYEQADQGHLVDVGDCTCFRNPSGFLGKHDLSGFAYVPPEYFPGVELPQAGRAITAILLTAEEATVVQSFGSYRVISLLGQVNRYYPCPPWSERHRSPVISPDDYSKSLLTKMPIGYLRGATVRIFSEPIATLRSGDGISHSLGGDIRFRFPIDHLPRLQNELPRIHSAGGIAFLTDPDPEANARQVWRPGQKRFEAIISRGSDGNCTTGGFLALLRGEQIQDGGRFLEDGFVMQLCPTSWERVLEALRTGMPIQVAAGDPEMLGFDLEWKVTLMTQSASEYLYGEHAVGTNLPTREQIKMRLNFPNELPADYQADPSVPVLMPIHSGDIPMIIVITNNGLGYKIPRVLFEYLYRQRSLTPDDQRVIDTVLGQWVLGPESL